MRSMRTQPFVSVGTAGLIVILSLITISCGSSKENMPEAPAPETPQQQQAPLPRFPSVTIVMLQNTPYSAVFGAAEAQFLNGLAAQYAVAENYFGNSANSIENEMMVTTGVQTSSSVAADNIVRALGRQSLDWKAYFESLPSPGFTGDAYPYLGRHNPFLLIDDVMNNDAQRMKMVPFTDFSDDLASNSMPAYAFIVPNERNNGHDCPLAHTTCTQQDKVFNIDNWLSTNIGPVLASERFKSGGLLIILFDSGGDDHVNGGGHVFALFAQAKAKPGYHSITFAQHQSTLRISSEGLGISPVPGAGADAPNLADMFQP
jgi:phosphatidylinositol-3-phosphatase